MYIAASRLERGIYGPSIKEGSSRNEKGDGEECSIWSRFQ
jgi:hypothetical protein